LCLTAAYLVVELVGGLLTNSVSLLADAAHMLTDVGGLALALFAARMARRPPSPERTYGWYRLEILAAAVNAAVLLAVSAYILFEAAGRLREPPEVAALPMLAVASAGLAVNLVGARLLWEGSARSLNVRGAFLELVGDLLGSVGVIAAAAVTWSTGWPYADPLFGIAIGLFILPRTWALLGEAVHVLLEGTPARIDPAAVERAIASAEGVASVHDLHVWTVGSGLEALTAHVVLAEDAAPDAARRLPRTLAETLRREFGIAHSTVQVEDPGGCPNSSPI
jgi:cobalt-zinc-cadmium efflux system protein